MKQTIRIRNLRHGEAITLPAALLSHGMPYLVEDWVWVVEVDDHPVPFALIVTSFAHGWAVLWRVLALSPLPSTVPLTWFKEALPQVFRAMHARGCVWFLTLLGDSPTEAKLARIVQSAAGGALVPFQGALAVGKLMREAEVVEMAEESASIVSDSLPPLDLTYAQALINSFAGMER